MKRITTTLALVAILLPGAALAAPTDEQKCQKALRTSRVAAAVDPT
jgi:hypothetical protein